MRISTTIVAPFIVLLHVSTAAAQQTGRATGPQPPGGRIITSSQDCTNLQQEWDAYKAQYGVQHQACLDAHRDGRVRGGPTCSKAPCQQLHYFVYEYGASESSRMMDECRAAVRQIEKQKAEIARQEAEYQAAVRRYNQQVAEQNRRLLDALNQQKAEVAEQNRLAQELVEQRNRAAQQVFQDLVRQYNLPLRPGDGAPSSLRDMREALRGLGSSLSNRVSGLVDELDALTFDDAVNGLRDASSSFGTVFEMAHAAHGLEPPERVTSIVDSLDRWTAAWNVFKAGLTSASNTATPQERFNSQISGLSSSTTFLFRRTPWTGGVVAENIEGIGRWSNTSWNLFESSLNGNLPTNDEIRESFGRAMFPISTWLNDKINQVQGTRDDLTRLLGR